MTLPFEVKEGRFRIQEPKSKETISNFLFNMKSQAYLGLHIRKIHGLNKYKSKFHFYTKIFKDYLKYFPGKISYQNVVVFAGKRDSAQVALE